MPRKGSVHWGMMGRMGTEGGSFRVVAGRYRLEARLGRGGMGVVWRATDQLLGRQVAVKELALDLSLTDEEEPGRRDRTLREARAVAQLRHPHIVVVHDVVEHDERPYMVMELIDGGSLADRIARRGPVDAREAARIGIALLGALRRAHEAGVLHRDLKPANVLLEEGTDRVVLTDFGIAQVAGATTLTENGSFVGSPEYTAPERMAGIRTGPESDLWSLGALLCTALSGESPFHRDSLGGILHAVVVDEIHPPAQAAPILPVVRGLLERDPDRRLDAAEAERLLQAYRDTGRTPRLPTGYSPTRRNVPRPPHGRSLRRPHEPRDFLGFRSSRRPRGGAPVDSPEGARQHPSGEAPPPAPGGTGATSPAAGGGEGAAAGPGGTGAGPETGVGVGAGGGAAGGPGYGPGSGPGPTGAPDPDPSPRSDPDNPATDGAPSGAEASPGDEGSPGDGALAGAGAPSTSGAASESGVVRAGVSEPAGGGPTPADGPVAPAHGKTPGEPSASGSAAAPAVDTPPARAPGPPAGPPAGMPTAPPADPLSAQEPSPECHPPPRRSARGVLVAAALVAAMAGAGVSAAALLMKQGGLLGGAPVSSTSPGSGASTSPGAPSSTRPSSATAAVPAVPPGYLLARDPGGFALAVPEGFTREPQSERVFYLSPGGTFRLGVRTGESERGGPLGFMRRAHARGPDTNPGYRDGRVTRTERAGHPAALREFTWGGFNAEEGARHTYDLCWEQDGRLYDVWVSAPVAREREAKRHFDVAVASFVAEN